MSLLLHSMLGAMPEHMGLADSKGVHSTLAFDSERGALFHRCAS